MVDPGEWIPNFDLFVLWLLPLLLGVTVLVILLDFWQGRGKGKKRSYGWMDYVIWLTAVYFVVPFWRIVQYLQGDKSWTVLVEELFTDDFFNYMVILLMAGILGAIYIMQEKLRRWGVGS
jgi:putative effector of murein hydrolase